ncbi:hypothetical protein G7Z17_g5636 [Cylindrodendrum hubeiense]|uniref:DNA (cytosine-5-)-methyltransferase n=1 Tax=Cylindrodendrum hubeiense TaxID=595255 RepID=A0A9P5LFY9_9HYPO|nr:hypothetical protein G7Z17_g5636 [Cylindrodendrum hubeiense]
MDWLVTDDDPFYPVEEGSIFDKEFQTVTQSEDDLFAVESWPIGLVDNGALIHDNHIIAEQSGLLTAAPSLSPASCPVAFDSDLPDAIKEYALNAPEVCYSESVKLGPDRLATHDDEELILDDTPDIPMSKSLSIHLPESTLITPRSCYEPFEPGVPIKTEAEAVRLLCWAAKRAGQDVKFIEFQLDNFAVYRDKPQFPEEMRSLHQLDTKTGHRDFFFDGQLSVGDTAFFVRRVPISVIPIDNYGTLTKHTVRDKIWLRSDLNSDREIYYRLRTPAFEYRRFFNPFLWVADLAKHFVDFLKVMSENRRKVTIFHFRSTFGTWMNKVHKTVPEFVAWRNQFPRDDFRGSIIANLGFLHKEAVGVLGYEKTYAHTLWSEVWEYRCYKPPGKPFEDKTQNPLTVVTQYIYDCFAHLPFGDRLEAVPLSKGTQSLRNKLIQQRHLELPSPIHDTAKCLSTAAKQQIRDIKPGDTISTQRDGAESGTQWRRDVSHGFNDVDRWFALVQHVHVDRRGHRSFDVIWYYRAVDTLCGIMKYPWNNELFLSDHCSCGEDSKITESEVLGVHEVEFGGTSATHAELFCRQTYIHAERKWITLKENHMCCKHTNKPSRGPKYKPGETLLVILDRSTGRSEPCEFVTSYREEATEIFRFRRLLRRSQVDPKAKTVRRNELVYSQQLVEVKKQRIRQPCFVRFFKTGEPIPTPYDRDGVGSFFYITHQETFDEYSHDVSYTPLETFPSSLRQGHDPGEEITRLRGLDLFCGGGNFGRGLEDGGGIEMRWANDYDTKAMHTYMANVSAPEAVSPFLGSIDDLQRLAIKGHFSRNVPRIGEVDFISGGSPCPGFSHLTNDKTTLAQRKNQSLVAAFGSFIDLYRPRYGLLENVPGIVQKKANRDQDVFSQLICAIVGLGYQTHFFFLDASSCGSPQRRSRVFLAFAAPGLHLPRRPDPTHAHPPLTKSLSLGNLPTGEPMAERAMPDATPFDFVSARLATADLPPVYDSKPDICVPFPDHRISLGFTKQLRLKVNLIPTQPWGMNFAQAWFGIDRKLAGSGVLTAAERLVFPPDNGGSLSRSRPNSNAYGRQFPARLIETVVTSQSPSDAKNGRTLHWRENRVLTIMEARRAQGFRDDDVLLGTPPDQYRIVGNSVAREVAVALGIVFREAWVCSLAEERRGQEVAAAVANTIPVAPVVVPINTPFLNHSGVEPTTTPIIEDVSSDSSLDTGPDVLSRLRTSPGQTPASSMTPDLTPPPSSHTSLPTRDSKRSRSSSLAVEIRAPKATKSKGGDSPNLAATRLSAMNGGLVDPSPLGQSVIMLEDN